MQQSTSIENWKPTIKVFKKNPLYKPIVEKVSTKTCPICSNEHLLLTRSLNLKSCTDCYIDIPWYLEINQQPLQ